MSTLTERLTRLNKSAAPRVNVFTELDNHEVYSTLGLVVAANQKGQFMLRVIKYPIQHFHGTYSLHALRGYSSGLGHLLKCELPIQPVDLLFFDTETTGLGVGAGTVAFMIGIGYYHEDEFTIEQMFIRHPGEEASMLHHLHQRLEEHPILVSFNGKSFDWPIVKNRYVMNRLKLQEQSPAHLDLLHPARSLWKHTLSSCRLSSLEQYKLGIVRHHDLPGALAPEMYVRYLHEGNIQIMDGVFVHNEWDILSLTTLTAHLCRVISLELPQNHLSAEELYRMGLWLERMKQTSSAHVIMNELQSRCEGNGYRYLLELAAFYKKDKKLSLAAVYWERYTVLRQDHLSAFIEPWIELAMYHEHTTKNHWAAKHWAEEALFRLNKKHSMLRARITLKDSEVMDRLRSRINRLQTRIDRMESRDEMMETSLYLT